MNFKSITIWLRLAVLMAIVNRGRADQLSDVPQTDKARAAPMLKEFAAFWTTENTQPVKIPPTLANPTRWNS